MFNIPVQDKTTALLILWYAQQGAQDRTNISLIEAPKILALTKELRETVLHLAST